MALILSLMMERKNLHSRGFRTDGTFFLMIFSIINGTATTRLVSLRKRRLEEWFSGLGVRVQGNKYGIHTFKGTRKPVRTCVAIGERGNQLVTRIHFQDIKSELGIRPQCAVRRSHHSFGTTGRAGSVV